MLRLRLLAPRGGVLAVVLVSLALAGCGVKGPLVPAKRTPEAAPPPPATTAPEIPSATPPPPANPAP